MNDQEQAGGPQPPRPLMHTPPQTARAEATAAAVKIVTSGESPRFKPLEFAPGVFTDREDRMRIQLGGEGEGSFVVYVRNEDALSAPRFGSDLSNFKTVARQSAAGEMVIFRPGAWERFLEREAVEAANRRETAKRDAPRGSAAEAEDTRYHPAGDEDVFRDV